MVKKPLIYTVIVAALLVFGGLQPAGAVLQDFDRVNNALGVAGQDSGYPAWYQDTNNLKLDLCNFVPGSLCVDPAEAPDATLGVAGETFWWSAGAEVPPIFDGTVPLVEFALEGAFANEVPIVGDNVAFGRIRLRIQAGVAGTYTVTHPFGTFVQTIAAADIVPGFEINATEDIGCLAVPCDFSLALASSIGPFLFWDSDLPQTDAAGNFYIGDAITGHRVLGSPTGNNFVRIEGPAGSGFGGPGVDFVETDLFTVEGRVSLADGDGPAIANADAGSINAGTPLSVDVLANDLPTNIPLNPGSVTVDPASVVGGTAVRSVVNGNVMVTYTPAAGFTGPGSFNYTVQTFTNTNLAAQATASVFVEDLQANRAVFRPKLTRWELSGTSSDTAGNIITVRAGSNEQTASLSGAQEVPPVTTIASGAATVTINDAQTAISFSVNVTDIENVTAAHIHVGRPGVSGPIIFDLATAAFATASGTLTAADLQPSAVDGINTFADAVAAILAGNTYVNVHTTLNPGGEIRGQLGTGRFIGTCPVEADGTWRLVGGNRVFPDNTRSITAESSNGVRIVNVPVEIR